MTTTGTVSGMCADGQPRADHGPYIAAVRRALEALDIEVVSITVTTSAAGRREATLELRPDQDAIAEPMPAHASARWDEDSGWQLLVPRETLASHDVSEGTSILLSPGAVAAWAVVTLAHPELSLSAEREPVPHNLGTDPEFEERLARYQPGT